MLAGLDQASFDKIKTISTNKYYKEGTLIARPLKKDEGYSPSSHVHYLKQAKEYLREFSDADLCALLVYIDRKDDQTKEFCRSFFPFALARGVEPPTIEAQGKPASYRRALNDFATRVLEAVNQLKESVGAVRGTFSGNNLTPLLLPIRNFRSDVLRSVLQDLFIHLGNSTDPRRSLEEARERILRAHPWVTPSDSRQRCLSDGVLHFKSPGSARHGKARFQGLGEHWITCHLNGKCRLGATYVGNFHYDCVPARGALKRTYGNCHNVSTAAKGTHVNIAPNDFII